jgi:hypothetical protein
MTTFIAIDTHDYPVLQGQEPGRELEIELTAIVTRVELAATEGGSPSERVTMIVTRLDIGQTT